MDIGARIRSIRINRGFSQEYLADCLQISQKTYSQLENQRIKISITRLRAIAATFEMPLSQLVSPDVNNNNKSFDPTSIYTTLELFKKQLEELRKEVGMLRTYNQTA